MLKYSRILKFSSIDKWLQERTDEVMRKSEINSGMRRIRIEGDRGLPLMDALLTVYAQDKDFAEVLSRRLEIIPRDGAPLNIYDREFPRERTRFTEYHAGIAVIRDKALLSQAMAKLARYEDLEE